MSVESASGLHRGNPEPLQRQQRVSNLYKESRISTQRISSLYTESFYFRRRECRSSTQRVLGLYTWTFDHLQRVSDLYTESSVCKGSVEQLQTGSPSLYREPRASLHREPQILTDRVSTFSHRYSRHRISILKTQNLEPLQGGHRP